MVMETWFWPPLVVTSRLESTQFAGLRSVLSCKIQPLAEALHDKPTPPGVALLTARMGRKFATRVRLAAAGNE